MSNAGRILVVEDHETERRAVSQILKSEGFTVYGAENADKALSYIDENVDVVLRDPYSWREIASRSASVIPF